MSILENDIITLSPNLVGKMSKKYNVPKIYRKQTDSPNELLHLHLSRQQLILELMHSADNFIVKS